MRTLSVALAALLLFGCKPKADSGSETKFDSETGSKLSSLDTHNMSPRVAQAICDQNVIGFFFGNAEFTVALYGENTTETIATDWNYLEKEVKKSAESLHKVFEDYGNCDGMSDGKYKNPKYMLFVSVIDAGGSKDTEITTTWYGDKNRKDMKFIWGKLKSQKWAIDENGSVTPSEHGLTEIHFPTQLDKLVNHFVNLKPPGEEVPADFKFSHSFYIFKSHGGRYLPESTEANMKNYANLFSEGSNPSMGRAFMFDPSSSTKRQIGSGLYSVAMKEKAGCEAFSKIKNKYSSGLCNRCAKSSKDKNWCKKVASLGEGMQSDTLGEGMQSDTLGEGMQSDTLGEGMQSDTLGEGMQSDTLGEGMQSDTLGEGMQSDTLSTGKGILFSSKPAKGSFDVIKEMAQGIAYSGTAPSGLATMQLPLLGSELMPGMVVLDSCFGDKGISKNMFNRKGSAFAVSVWNPNPMGMWAMNYSVFDYFSFLTLPALVQEVDMGAKMGKSQEVLNDIRDTINTSGLSNTKTDKKLRQVVFSID